MRPGVDQPLLGLPFVRGGQTLADLSDGQVIDHKSLDSSRRQSGSLASEAGRCQAIDINVPIGCGDAPVFPGDIVVGDNDGVIVVPAGLADELADEATRDDRVRGFRGRAGQ
jgi:regulator of RNase E activity RraA